MGKTPSRLRRSIRYEAARIMAEDGIRDFRKAKRKACGRLGVATNRSIPTNLEIEDSLEEHLAIFNGDELPDRQQLYIRAAFTVMQWFRHCSPRLVGAAVSGTITPSRPVELQLFPDTFEEIGIALEDQGIGFRISEKRLRFQREGFRNMSGFEFQMDGVDIEVMVFLPGDPYPPLSRVTGKTIQWISMKKVSRLLGG
ncbi:MAG: hypothetical protein OXI60_08170 [Acidiferrobacterales bacterium]|nr:hypothetical protein [Acidiferrobacterales bacterium]